MEKQLKFVRLQKLRCVTIDKRLDWKTYAIRIIKNLTVNCFKKHQPRPDYCANLIDNTVINIYEKSTTVSPKCLGWFCFKYVKIKDALDLKWLPIDEEIERLTFTFAFKALYMTINF